MGGWIINSKKYFCHDGKDGSCFDKYCQRKKGETMPGHYGKKMKKPMTKKKKMDKKKKKKMKGKR